MLLCEHPVRKDLKQIIIYLDLLNMIQHFAWGIIKKIDPDWE